MGLNMRSNIIALNMEKEHQEISELIQELEIKKLKLEDNNLYRKPSSFRIHKKSPVMNNLNTKVYVERLEPTNIPHLISKHTHAH